MKKALDAAAVIAKITIAGWSYQQNKEIELSDLAMENIEALASGENDPKPGDPCYNGEFDSSKPEVIHCAHPCKPLRCVPGTISKCY